MLSLTAAMMTLALTSWVVAGFWLGAPILPRFQRPFKDAQALNLWLQEWQLGLGQGRPLGQLGEVPQFKFFGRLAMAGLSHARSFGSFPREILWEWREGLSKEMQFEKKWQGLRNGGWAQFGLFSLITWIFITLTMQTLGKGFPYSLTVAVATLQGLGLGLFWPVMKIFSFRRLNGFPQMLESLYILRSLGGAGLPSQQVIQAAQLDQLAPLKNPALKLLKSRVNELVQIYQKQGVPLVKETQLLLQETWFLRDEELTKLMKLGEHVKLAFLILFFGGGYFLFLIGLIHHLLSQG